ncbi:alpha/beta fold hydrolase [Nonomuraea turcica]|uniref:alpha/beta fold hydrolase n=1 Tax=Nonomuraea sp. G32 TaxID=3067274 RepID=UPI00273AF0BB|nr:alpha/beta hydrolase [Nonomuraea sp. G32]MDP4504049.1 alpha/beta hydrolase [Nonomuraea sp. G32]
MEVVRLLKRSFAAAAITTAALGAASAAYQTWGSVRDRRRYPPPGRMVDVDGRRIHLWTAGDRAPTVVIIPALGESSVDFAILLPALVKETRTVIFDRAGLGWSDPVWNPIAQLNAADDLHTALHRAGIEPPYILAGHSMGGYIVHLFAAEHPEEVAGIVFIDSSHPDQHRRFPNYHWGTLKHAAMRRAKWFGLRRLARDLGLAEEPSSLVPPEYAEVAVALSLSDRRRRTSWWELALRAQIGSAVSRRSGPLGDIPVTVLTCSEVDPTAKTPQQLTACRKHFRTWYPLQVDLANLSTDSKHVVAENAGHYIHHDQPELVVEAILDLVRRART